MTPVQWLLVAAILALPFLGFLYSTTSRGKALRRLFLLLLAGILVFSVLRPDLWTQAAGALGVGRGADLLLYLLALAVVYLAVWSYLRMRDYRESIATLVRALGLLQAEVERLASAPVAQSTPAAGERSDDAAGSEDDDEDDEQAVKDRREVVGHPDIPAAAARGLDNELGEGDQDRRSDERTGEA